MWTYACTMHINNTKAGSASTENQLRVACLCSRRERSRALTTAAPLHSRGFVQEFCWKKERYNQLMSYISQSSTRTDRCVHFGSSTISLEDKWFPTSPYTALPGRQQRSKPISANRATTPVCLRAQVWTTFAWSLDDRFKLSLAGESCKLSLAKE